MVVPELKSMSLDEVQQLFARDGSGGSRRSKRRWSTDAAERSLVLAPLPPAPG